MGRSWSGRSRLRAADLTPHDILVAVVVVLLPLDGFDRHVRPESAEEDGLVARTSEEDAIDEVVRRAIDHRSRLDQFRLYDVRATFTNGPLQTLDETRRVSASAEVSVTAIRPLHGLRTKFQRSVGNQRGVDAELDEELSEISLEPIALRRHAATHGHVLDKGYREDALQTPDRKTHAHGVKIRLRVRHAGAVTHSPCRVIHADRHGILPDDLTQIPVREQRMLDRGAWISLLVDRVRGTDVQCHRAGAAILLQMRQELIRAHHAIEASTSVDFLVADLHARRQAELIGEHRVVLLRRDRKKRDALRHTLRAERGPKRVQAATEALLERRLGEQVLEKCVHRDRIFDLENPPSEDASRLQEVDRAELGEQVVRQTEHVDLHEPVLGLVGGAAIGVLVLASELPVVGDHRNERLVVLGVKANERVHHLFRVHRHLRDSLERPACGFD